MSVSIINWRPVLSRPWSVKLRFTLVLIIERHVGRLTTDVSGTRLEARSGSIHILSVGIIYRWTRNGRQVK